MFNKFNINLCKIFKGAEVECLKLNHSYVGSEHLILSLLKNSEDIKNLMLTFNINYNNYYNSLVNIIGFGNNEKVILYTPLLKLIVDNLLGYDEINEINLFKSILESGEGIGLRVLLVEGVDLEELYSLLKDKQKKRSLIVDNYGINLNNNKDEKILCRDEDIKKIITTLTRLNKTNPLLIGEAGVGKTTIIKELARKIENKEVPSQLLNKCIYSIDLSSVLAGTKYRGEFENRLNEIISEVKSKKNIILFIDEIHTIVNAGGAEGAIDAANILKPYLSSGEISIIGATTTKEYYNSIYKDKALNRRFNVINIKEPSEEETSTILKSLKKKYEKYYNLKIDNKLINYIVSETSKYIRNKCNPDKSIEVLDAVCSNSVINNKSNDNSEIISKLNSIINTKNNLVKKNNYKKALAFKDQEIYLKNILVKSQVIKIKKSDIDQVIKLLSNINIKNINVCQLKKNIKKQIINQDNIIDSVCDSIKSFINQNNKTRPLSMLFCGSSGVGKTKISKEIAKHLFNEDCFIKLDMSEFNSSTSITKLIGSNPGYVGYNDDYVFNKLRSNPYSLLLLDEVDKCSPSVLNLFLQILDDGYITSSIGEKIYFNNVIIIMTCNIINNKNPGFFNNTTNNLNDFLSKELLNRIDNVYEFNSFDENLIKKYILNKIKVDRNLLNKLVIDSNYEKFGLRHLDRLLEKMDVKYNK